jgi:hypothetical protein
MTVRAKGALWVAPGTRWRDLLARKVSFWPLACLLVIYLGLWPRPQVARGTLTSESGSSHSVLSVGSYPTQLVLPTIRAGAPGQDVGNGCSTGPLHTAERRGRGARPGALFAKLTHAAIVPGQVPRAHR